MIRAIALLAATLTMLTGCAAGLGLRGDEWTRPGTGVSQLTWDEIDCARDARDAGKTPDLIVGGLVDIARDVVREGGRAARYSRCMTDRGYRAAG